MADENTVPIIEPRAERPSGHEQESEVCDDECEKVVPTRLDTEFDRTLGIDRDGEKLPARHVPLGKTYGRPIGPEMQFQRCLH